MNTTDKPHFTTSGKAICPHCPTGRMEYIETGEANYWVCPDCGELIRALDKREAAKR